MDDDNATRAPARDPRATGVLNAMLTFVVTSLVLAAPAAAQHGGHAHAHGLVQLEVAVDAGSVDLRLDAPLDSLLGFERAPRSEAERRAVAALRERLAQPATLFGLDAAAGCVAEPAAVVAPVLDGGAAAAEHADLEARYRFRCRQPGVLRVIDLQGLLGAFGRIRQVQAQVVTPGAQLKQTLKRPQALLRLSR